MNCNEFQNRLDQALEHQESVDTPELKLHTVECVECRAAWESCLLLEPAIQNWNERAARDVDLVDGVIARLREQGVAFRDSAPQATRRVPAATPQSKRPWVVIALSAACVVGACILAFQIGPNGSQVADKTKQADKVHVVPDDFSNGPFKNQENGKNDNTNNNKTVTQVASLSPSDVEGMMINAQSGLESLRVSVRKKVSELSDIVPSKFNVWDNPGPASGDPDTNGGNATQDGTPNPWLQRLFDTANKFDSETT